jgi:hypothetical protein
MNAPPTGRQHDPLRKLRADIAIGQRTRTVGFYHVSNELPAAGIAETVPPAPAPRVGSNTDR